MSGERQNDMLTRSTVLLAVANASGQEHALLAWLRRYLHILSKLAGRSTLRTLGGAALDHIAAWLSTCIRLGWVPRVQPHLWLEDTCHIIDRSVVACVDLSCHCDCAVCGRICNVYLWCARLLDQVALRVASETHV